MKKALYALLTAGMAGALALGPAGAASAAHAWTRTGRHRASRTSAPTTSRRPRTPRAATPARTWAPPARRTAATRPAARRSVRPAGADPVGPGSGPAHPSGRSRRVGGARGAGTAPWRAADRFDPRLASLRVRLFAIARNAMLDHLRAARVRPWQDTLIDPPTAERVAGTVEDASDRLVRRWVVEEALRRLSEEHRTALVQTHLRERPYGEVADELGYPSGRCAAACSTASRPCGWRWTRSG